MNKKKNKNKNVCKLFCIAYVKIFCHKFINYINKNEIKDFQLIINEINKSKTLSKIITLYIYKVIYNTNDRNAYLFSIKQFIDNYHLKEYNHFKEFQINDSENELLMQNNFNKDYKNICETMVKYKLNNFKEVNIDEFDIEGIDNFYFASSKL